MASNRTFFLQQLGYDPESRELIDTLGPTGLVAGKRVDFVYFASFPAFVAMI